MSRPSMCNSYWSFLLIILFFVFGVDLGVSEQVRVIRVESVAWKSSSKVSYICPYRKLLICVSLFDFFRYTPIYCFIFDNKQLEDGG